MVRVTCDSATALQGHDLGERERAAVGRGDISWWEARVGRLTGFMRTWTRPVVPRADCGLAAAAAGPARQMLLPSPMHADTSQWVPVGGCLLYLPAIDKQ
jgi:hypothetical protein